jgi:hypothetical protein
MVSDFSDALELSPGDIIMTGTTAGSGEGRQLRQLEPDPRPPPAAGPVIARQGNRQHANPGGQNHAADDNRRQSHCPPAADDTVCGGIRVLQGNQRTDETEPFRAATLAVIRYRRA